VNNKTLDWVILGTDIFEDFKSNGPVNEKNEKRV